MRAVLLSCVPEGVRPYYDEKTHPFVPSTLGQSGSTTTQAVSTLRAQLGASSAENSGSNRTVTLLMQYLGALLSLRPHGTWLPEPAVALWVFTHRQGASPFVSPSIDSEIGLTLSALANWYGNRAEAKAQVNEFEKAAEAFRVAAEALNLLGDWVERSASVKSAQWPAPQDFPLTVAECRARATLLPILARQCAFVAAVVQQKAKSVWLPLGLRMVREYTSSAEAASATTPAWVSAFARGHASYWLMHCAHLAYLLECKTRKAGGGDDLSRQERLLAVAHRCAREALSIFKGAKTEHVIQECTTMRTKCLKLATEARTQRFRDAVLQGLPTLTEDFTTLEKSDPFRGEVEEAEEATRPPSLYASDLWQQLCSEKDKWTASHGSPAKLPLPSLQGQSVPPLTDAVLLGDWAKEWPGGVSSLSLRDKILIIIGTHVERRRCLAEDPWMHQGELEEVERVFQTARKLLTLEGPN